MIGERQSGFTLIELLVAVAVIGFALSALLVNVMSHVDAQAHFRDKTFATWVARNILEQAQINNRYAGQQPNGFMSGVEIMAGKEWFWQMTTMPSADQRFLRLEIHVHPNSSKESDPLVSMQGALGTYEK